MFISAAKGANNVNIVGGLIPFVENFELELKQAH